MDTNNHLELEQMRAQLGILKQKLEKQDIVNERLMRKSMKSKMSWINKYLVIVIFAIPFVAFAMLPMVHEMNISWWWYGFTLVMMTGSIIADWYINYMRDDVFLRGNHGSSSSSTPIPVPLTPTLCSTSWALAICMVPASEPSWASSSACAYSSRCSAPTMKSSTT